MSEKPFVSICCDVYNHEDYIAQAIEGFLSQQTDFPLEILVHDDASTDGSPDVIRSYQHRYPHLIKPIFQVENQQSKGLKAGRFNFARARGDFIAICQGDDYWTDPLKLQKQVGFLSENAAFPMCFTDYSEVNSSGEIIRVSAIGDRKKRKRDLSQWEILTGVSPRYLTVVIRRSAFDLDLYNSVYVRNGDVFLSAIVTRHGPAKYMDFISGCYRVHSGGVWSGSSAIEQRLMKLESAVAMSKALRGEREVAALRIRIGKTMLEIRRILERERSFSAAKVAIRALFLYTCHLLMEAAHVVARPFSGFRRGSWQREG